MKRFGVRYWKMIMMVGVVLSCQQLYSEVPPSDSQPFMLESGDYTIGIKPEWGWTINMISYKGKNIGISNGSYGFVVNYGGNQFMGSSHSEEIGREDVYDIELTVDGKKVDLPQTAVQKGEKIVFVRKSHLKSIDIIATTTLTSDGLLRQVKMDITDDVKIHHLFPLMYIWPPSTTNWMAETRQGKLIEGILDNNQGWTIQEQVKWVAVYEPSMKLAACIWFDINQLPGELRKHSIWDLKVYHKQYYQAMSDRQLKKGEIYNFSAFTKVISVTSDNWTQMVNNAIKSIKKLEFMSNMVNSKSSDEVNAEKKN